MPMKKAMHKVCTTMPGPSSKAEIPHKSTTKSQSHMASKNFSPPVTCPIAFRGEVRREKAKSSNEFIMTPFLMSDQ